MSDILKDSAAENSPEAKVRADKIGKIKSSVQNSGESEWEREIAERIARKVQKVKENKNSEAEDILNELEAKSHEPEISETDIAAEAPIEENVPEVASANENVVAVPDAVKESSGALEITTSSFANTSAIGAAYLHDLPKYMGEMAIALLPIVVIFFAFQFLTLHMPRRNLAKIVIGILYTYVGLVLFLTGVNVGFSTLGEVLGAGLATGWTRWLLIPLSMLLGWFIISAEPAVAVLEAQIEEVSAGTIPGSAIKTSLSIAIALAMGFSMLRVLTGISIMWFLIPGYVVALGLSFFVPDLYTAIAFDSGGVASGPMTATFMLQFMIGASTVVGGNPLIDAFGVVAMVAMMPLISIQMVGFIYSRRTEPEIAREQYGDDEIIELWEVNAA